MNSRKKVLIAVGGTGGYVFPGYNLANYLSDKFEVELVTDKRGYKYIKQNKNHKISILPSAPIDDKNILKATLTAMRRAVDALAIRPDYVVVDGDHLPSWTYRSEAIVGGDNLVAPISAASVIAKVTRDHQMILYDSLYPGYDFTSNKGYGTATHIEALSAMGPTPIHRFSFAPLKDKIEL